MIEKAVKLLISHCLGDYCLQTAFLVEAKGTLNGFQIFHLLVHSLLYITPFIFLVDSGSISISHLILFVSHVIIDGLKTCGKLSFAQDQALHFFAFLLFLYP